MTCNHDTCSCDKRRGVPGPGSDAARINGCTCPTVFNAGTNPSEFGYIIDPTCPLHGAGNNE